MRVWVLNRLLPGKLFPHFYFPERTILKTLAPHDKKQIRKLVWNKNVSQVESSNRSLWNKF